MPKNAIKYIKGNQDVDTSFAALEMVWTGFRDKRIEDHAGMPIFDSICEIIKGRTINYFIDEKVAKPFIN